MKHKSLLFSLVISLLFLGGLCATAHAAQINESNPKIHLITAGDYRGLEGKIRNGIEKDVTSIQQFFQNHVSESQLELYEIDGKMVTPNKISATISSLNVKTEDTVIFYYSGRGANARENGGQYFQLKDEKGESVTLQRVEVRNEMVKTGAHLVVLLTDCCNFQLPITELSENSQSGTITMHSDYDIQSKTGNHWKETLAMLTMLKKSPLSIGHAIFWGYRPSFSIIEQLFIKPRGILDLNSCKIDQVSLAAAGGSIATQAWIEIFKEVNDELKKDSSKTITWYDIVPRMNQRQNELFKKKFPDGYKIFDNNGNCTLHQDTQDIHVFDYPDQPRFGARVQTTVNAYIVVTDIVPDSPAQKGGLQKGDVIDEINGLSIITEEEYVNAINSSPKKMTAIVKRIKDDNMETLTLNFTLIGPPKKILVTFTQDNNSTNENTADKPKFGIRLKNDGTEIVSVTPDSVADYHGLKEGDKIRKIDGKKVGNYEDIANALKQTGKKFKLTYFSKDNDNLQTITIDYENYKEHYNTQWNWVEKGKVVSLSKPRGKYKLGANIKGNVIVSVRENSPADEAGLVKGDKILKINGKKIKSSADLIKAIDEAEAGEKATFVVNKAETRKNVKLFIRLNDPNQENEEEADIDDIPTEEYSDYEVEDSAEESAPTITVPIEATEVIYK